MKENNFQDIVAKILIDIESVKFSFEEPFTLTSGNKRKKSLQNCLALTSDHREAKKLLSEMENVTTA